MNLIVQIIEHHSNILIDLLTLNAYLRSDCETEPE